MATSHESPLSILEGVPKAGNRRRHVRQKVHSPAYASFDGIGGGMVLDLTEVLNLCEAGMAIQANAALDVNRTLNLVLDLSETKSYVNATGMVVWTGKSGVAGIRFSKMADAPRRQLKEWLFHNALTAAAKAVQRPAEDALPAPVQAPLPTAATTQPKSDSPIEEPTEEVPSAPVLLTADAPTLNIIQQEVEALGSNVDAALRLLVQRSQALTRASGAAIALAQGTEMVCRASSGDAPPLGAKLQIGSGFSGACVRTAKMQRCDDSDTNPLVDRESCRQLSIRSMIAAPIVTNGVVIGLLEVFSPSPFSFGEGDATALQRLSEIIGQTVSGSLNVGAESETVVLPEPRPFWKRQFTRTEIVLATLAALLLIAISYVLITWIPRSGFVAPTTPTPQAPGKQVVAQPAGSPATLQEWRALAERGDAMAQFEVGRHYAVGEGVKQDYSEAVQWFTKAAEQGHVRAQGMLGAYYMVGRGVPQDFEKAYFWSVLARAGLDEYSKSRVMFLTSRMTPAQVSAAQQRAEAWIRDHQTTASR
jgi:putative methionine-R-sulfoxide reductase with GAF domain